MSVSPHPTTFAVIGRVIDDGVDHGEAAVVVDGGRVVARLAPGHWGSLPAARYRASIVSPGFVDLQVNGAFGFEVGEDADALGRLAERLPECGVTTFLPALVSRPEADYPAAFAAFSRATSSPGRRPAARMGGLHLEGPLLAPGRSGAHDRAAIEAASVEGLTRILATGATGALAAPVALVTLAPERVGALPLVAELTARGIAVSLGHTDASYEIATRAIDAGARLATHVWNAMPPLHHRAPGAVGAVLGDDRVTALFIADGVHLHPAVLKVGLAAKPPERRGIVSDAIGAAGLAAGPARLGGQVLHLEGGSARLPDGTLAGATLLVDEALRRVRAATDLGAAATLQLATATPGRALRARPGRLAIGGAADLVLLDEAWGVLGTFVGGELAFARGDDVDAIRA